MANPNAFSLERLHTFHEFFSSHPECTITEAANYAGLSFNTARRYYLLHKAGKLQSMLGQSHVKKVEASDKGVPQEGAKTNSDGSIELVTVNPCTLEDLLTACKVDLKLWQVARWVANKWEVGTKQEDGSVLRTPLYQVKAFLERIPGIDTANSLREVLEEIRRAPPVRPVVPKSAARCLEVDDPHLLEIDLADLHFDRLAWEGESGESWDMKISSHVAVQAVRRLLDLSSPFPVKRILYICGNDYYTTDTPADTTTAGTPQDADGRWQKSFKHGVRLQTELIDIMRRRAPVDVVVVPGNHDSTKMFYAGVVLEAVYSKCQDVRVINDARPRKYYRWGTTLLGYAHGHNEKHGTLPLIMAGEAPEDWAKTTHREFHVGHFHHKRETQFHAGIEVGPVRVRILPSLTATDGWHGSQGYVGAQKACEAYLWSEARGYVGHFSWGPGTRRDIPVTQGSGK